MGLTEKLQRARELRDARDEGFQVALGLPSEDVEPTATAPPPSATDRRVCATCGVPGIVEFVDLVGDLTSLRCPRCGTAWDDSAIASSR